MLYSERDTEIKTNFERMPLKQARFARLLTKSIVKYGGNFK